ncbi:hypothetical protein SXCC_00220 [Gluconacetobacter sp. SXCC-1]|nr:hypothetical protein SXCC_00220 [Gluconacetobacter sp. SXCC-1]
MERAAFREMHITGTSPVESANASPAAQNVEAIAEELLEKLSALAENAR